MATGYHFGYENDDDEDNDLDDPESQFYGNIGSRDGLIFLIDTTKEMFDPGESDSPFVICMKCAKTTLQNKIVSSDRDLVGIVFFGTEQSNCDFKNIYIYQELEQPGAEKILQLEKLVDDCVASFNKDFGHSPVFSISHALWACSNLFSKCSFKLGSKRILLFTNNDDPHADSPSLQNQARTKANDLYENDIDLELLHLKSPWKPFNYVKFYKELIFTADDNLTELPDPSEKLEELLTRVRARDHKKRAMCRINFTLADGVDMAIGVYNLIGASSKPYAIKLLKTTNEELRTKSTILVNDTGEALGPDELGRAQRYGGRQICFSADEIAQVKSFSPPGLTLLGFKPASKLKDYYHVKHAQFIYPNEKMISGSTSLFTALLKKCLDRNVVPVCRYVARKNSPPRLVMLLPQEEEFDDNKVQVTPPGFHLILLPFADDFRQVTMSASPTANTDQINKAKELVKKLKFPFSPDSFENPVLQQYWRHIEALALDRKEPDEMTDHTLPNIDMIQTRAGTLISEFIELVFPDGYTPRLKRKPPASTNKETSKRTKVDLTQNVDLEKICRDQQLGHLTVPILKDFVKRNNIPVISGKKADLITAIEKHFSE